VITEGVKSALAQIAASTIHSHHDEEVVEAAPVTEAPPVERPKKQRKKRSDAPAKTPRADVKQPRTEGGSQRTEKDLLLDSVLSALPEPKAPGQGRGRRRVTTAALSGTPVSHAPED